MIIEHIEYYRAVDGTIFEDEAECLEYELSKLYPNWRDGIKTYLEDMTLIDGFEYGLERCRYIYIKNEHSLKGLKAWNNYHYGYCYINDIEKAGLYDAEMEFNIEEAIEHLTKIMAKVKEGVSE